MKIKNDGNEWKIKRPYKEIITDYVSRIQIQHGDNAMYYVTNVEINPMRGNPALKTLLFKLHICKSTKSGVNNKTIYLLKYHYKTIYLYTKNHYLYIQKHYLLYKTIYLVIYVLRNKSFHCFKYFHTHASVPSSCIMHFHCRLNCEKKVR